MLVNFVQVSTVFLSCILLHTGTDYVIVDQSGNGNEFLLTLP